MDQPIPLNEKEFFEEVTHQGKTIKVGDQVIIRQAGQIRLVEVSSLSKSQGHYWVGYNNNQQVCPWPLVQLPMT